MSAGAKSFFARWLWRAGAVPVTPSSITDVRSGQLRMSAGTLALRGIVGSVSLQIYGPDVTLVISS